MTTTKKPKRQKLRNSEYYDFQDVQDKLYADSMRNKMFKKILPIILTEQNILLAYRNIKKTKGAKPQELTEKQSNILQNGNRIKLSIM